MDMVKVTIELPADVVEEAKALGIDIEARGAVMLEDLQKQILKHRAALRLDEIRTKMESLPPDMQMTPEDIDAEIRAYRQEKAAKWVGD